MRSCQQWDPHRLRRCHAELVIIIQAPRVDTFSAAIIGPGYVRAMPRLVTSLGSP